MKSQPRYQSVRDAAAATRMRSPTGLQRAGYATDPGRMPTRLSGAIATAQRLRGSNQRLEGTQRQ